jgi:hypothetical protein
MPDDHATFANDPTPDRPSDLLAKMQSLVNKLDAVWGRPGRSEVRCSCIGRGRLKELLGPQERPAAPVLYGIPIVEDNRLPGHILQFVYPDGRYEFFDMGKPVETGGQP